MNLNQVTLPATDMARSVAFYTGMGFQQIVDAPHYARFESLEGDATFSLHLGEGGGNTVVYFECGDLDSRVQDLSAAGYDFEQLPKDEDWLWREARLKDPAGNEICLYWAGENRKNPPWRI